MVARIKSILTWAGLAFLVYLLFFGTGKIGQVIACVVAGLMVLNILLSKPENVTKHNVGLLVSSLLLLFVFSFLSAVNLGRPIAHTDGFFGWAEVDFDRNRLAYSDTGEAMFRIGLTTEGFEKLIKHYREIAQESVQNDDQYEMVYFELDPESIDRDIFLDSRDSVGGKPFASHLLNLETTDAKLVEGSRIKSGIESLMEGFPEFDDDLGRCRVIFWDSHEVTREFYWFEKEQQGYINP